MLFPANTGEFYPRVAAILQVCLCLCSGLWQFPSETIIPWCVCVCERERERKKERERKREREKEREKERKRERERATFNEILALSSL